MSDYEAGRAPPGRATSAFRALRGNTTRPHPGDSARWAGGLFAAYHTGPGGIARANKRTGSILAIPEPAQGRWRAFREGDCEGLLNAHRPHLGGGTILAARWRHRSSTDIDPFWSTGRWIPGERHGAIANWAGSRTPAPLSVSADTGPATKVITADGAVAFIEGEFAGRDFTRDLHDAAVAQLRDPQGLRSALHQVHDHDWMGTTRVERIPILPGRHERRPLEREARRTHAPTPAPNAPGRAPDIVAVGVSDFLGQHPSRSHTEPHHSRER